MIEFADDAAMQKKWKAFCRKIDTKPDAFDVVLRTIQTFLGEAFKSVVEQEEFQMKWSAEMQAWM